MESRTRHQLLRKVGPRQDGESAARGLEGGREKAAFCLFKPESQLQIDEGGRQWRGNGGRYKRLDDTRLRGPETLEQEIPRPQSKRLSWAVRGPEKQEKLVEDTPEG